MLLSQDRRRSRRVLLATFAAAALLGASASLRAQPTPWPNKPLKLLVGFPAGGASDVMARLIADKLAQGLGQAVVVDNRPGAAGTLAASLAARSAPDGYTLLLASPTAITLAPTTMVGKINYDPARELVPVSKVASYPLFLIARPGLNVKSVPELLQYARQNPGKLNFGSFGANTSGGLATEMVKLMAGIDALHVPYNGSAPALQALMGGSIDVMFDTAVTAIPNVKAGTLRALAVASPRRTSIAPELPTLAESLPGFEADSWNGLMVPAGTPSAVVSRLQAEVARFVTLADVKDRFALIGAEAVGSNAANFAAFLKEETERYARLVREANLKIE
jgi:tripartite-type tricarboxylate transporter receptor subunit TctC